MKIKALWKFGMHLVFAVSVLAVVGCSRGKEVPLDNEELLLISSGAFFQASLAAPNLATHENLWKWEGVDITDERLAREILLAMHPIAKVREGNLPEDLVEYKFLYQSGADPLLFKLYISDDTLVFSERKWIYEGGDAQKFKSAIEKLGK